MGRPIVKWQGGMGAFVTFECCGINKNVPENPGAYLLATNRKLNCGVGID